MPAILGAREVRMNMAAAGLHLVTEDELADQPIALTPRESDRLAMIPCPICFRKNRVLNAYRNDTETEVIKWAVCPNCWNWERL